MVEVAQILASREAQRQLPLWKLSAHKDKNVPIIQKQWLGLTACSQMKVNHVRPWSVEWTFRHATLHQMRTLQLCL